MSQTVFEKLQIREERNILIQGLPSSIEKQFLKITYSKSVTPLLKSRTIDFALIFAVNQQQLANIIGEVIPSLHKKSKFWVAYPKPTSKIVCDLNRDFNWSSMKSRGYVPFLEIELDNLWLGIRFEKETFESKFVGYEDMTQSTDFI
jgi:hypothetical protein